MAEYIKRTDALAYLDEGSYWEMEDFEEACALIKRVPAADVVEVQHGFWDLSDVACEPRCSICGEYALELGFNKFRSTYCPNCGAKMDGEDDEK